MIKYLGREDSKFLFSKNLLAVVVDEETNTVTSIDKKETLLASASWTIDEKTPSDTLRELASAAVTDLDITVLASNERLYTIPKAAQVEAKRGLEWRKEHKRGGTPVGLNTARRLAKGGQIGIEKVRHIAKYFPRHEVDKKAKGYKPGQDGYPSNGRIAWALWGGDAAQRWASAIVERENKKKASAAITAGLYEAYYGDERVDYSSFATGANEPDFYIRIRLDGSGIDRLYKVIEDGTCYVWDDGYWEDMGNVAHDFETYDRALDEAYDKVKKIRVPVDRESAISIAAMLDEDPMGNVLLNKINFDETELFEQAMPEIEWTMLDMLSSEDEIEDFEDEWDDGLLASATEFAEETDTTPGEYTPEERSESASQQVRDKLGRFAETGSRVVIGGDYNYQGVITAQNPDTGNVTVQLDNGASVEVPGNTTQEINTFEPVSQANFPATNLDFSGILGEPRTPIDQPLAQLPGRLPPLTAVAATTLINDWGAWVADQRLAPEYEPTPAAPFIPKKSPDINTAMGKYYQGAFNPDGTPKKGWNPAIAPNVANEPLLRDWLDKTYGAKTGGYQGGWYTPKAPVEKKLSREETYSPENVARVEAKYPTFAILAASEAEAVALTPETSDVAPIYMAVVANDDPQAVMELISLVPANSQSTTPVTFKRQPGKWVKDERILSDLKSPTPPPVVVLDNEMLSEVVSQIDGTVTASAIALSNNILLQAMIAAGGADRNRGNAEKLRRYWTIGRGGMKIRWGTPGDWTRCVRNLRKYLGPRAKGYCALRHKEMNGYWPGSRQNRKEFAPLDELVKDLEQIAIEENYDIEEATEFEIDSEIAQLLEEYADSDLDGPLMAAGGLDRNKGNAERLRRYWTVGPGALKIRWNTPGDWTRCYRQLAKYMGPRAKGYCALRHKEMNGVWPGDKRNIGKKKKAVRASAVQYGLVASTDSLKTSEQIISEFTLRARAESARSRLVGRDGVTPTQHGAPFVIPLVIPEGVETGDGRVFEPGSISMRDLPLPLLWQIKTGEGHDGSVVVGQITHMERTQQGIGNAYGVFDVGVYGKEAERLVRHGFIRGVSADMDKFEADEEFVDDDSDETKKIKSGKIKITNARVMAVTIVPKPAFQECYIQIVDERNDVEEEIMQPDGIYIDGVNALDASALVACGVVASSVPVAPPKEWFDNPKLQGPTPLTVEDDGRVFGHIAAWHVDHIGMTAGTRPPRSRSNYAYFHTGVVRTEEGDDIPVGQLTLAGGHAGLEASAQEAVRHYDDTASAVADVHAGEDAFGIWVAGSLRPGVTPEQVRALRASAPSGDWRPIKGRLELVAVCQVNVPGFPIARARVASGQVMALVAAGASMLAQMKHDPLAELNSKIDELSVAYHATKAEEAKQKFASLRSELLTKRALELSAKVKQVKDTIEDGDWTYMIEMFDDNPETEMAVVSRRVRERLAQEGKALPDGSFPIRNVSDLRKAVQAYGRAKPGKRAAVRKHIMKRARGLNRRDLIPTKWMNEASVDSDVMSLMDRALAAAATLEEFRDYSEETRKEYAKEGIAMPDGSFPIENEEDLKRAIKAHGRAKDIEKAKAHIKKRARALDRADLIPDEWKEASISEEDSKKA